VKLPPERGLFARDDPDAAGHEIDREIHQVFLSILAGRRSAALRCKVLETSPVAGPRPMCQCPIAFRMTVKPMSASRTLTPFQTTDRP
jgi:hypothetical protein